MATFNEIKEVRLRVDDPSGFIDLLDVTVLPGTPIHQTAYRYNGVYQYHDGTSWITIDLYVSDDRIGTWFDSEGEDYACVQAIKQIIAKLGKELRIKRSDAGAESTEWTSIKELLDYYKALLADFKDDYEEAEATAGPVWGASKAPEIAGGNL